MSDSKPPNKHRASAPAPQDSSMMLILSMADTTWRMFVPPAITVSLGIWADVSWGTKPWLTLLVGLPIGLLLSIVLIKRQLERTS